MAKTKRVLSATWSEGDRAWVVRDENGVWGYITVAFGGWLFFAPHKIVLALGADLMRGTAALMKGLDRDPASRPLTFQVTYMENQTAALTGRPADK